MYKCRAPSYTIQYFLTPGFSFGGSASFGQKLGQSTVNSGSSGIFGSLATPSKGVGFTDLLKSDDKPKIKDESVEVKGELKFQ